jgi:hypothetical protein
LKKRKGESVSAILQKTAVKLNGRRGIFIILRVSEECSSLFRVLSVSPRGAVKPVKILSYVNACDIPQSELAEVTDLTDEQKIAISAIRVTHF